MAINEDIWGDSTSWVDVLHGTSKTAALSNWGLVLDGTIPLNELVDNSPCYCGAVGNFYVCRPIVFFPDQETKALYPEYTINNWFFVHYAKSAGNSDTHEGCFTGTGSDNRFTEWTIPEMANYYSDYMVKTVFNLQLNKLLFSVQIHCQSSNNISDTVHTYTIGEYINNHHTTYPYITGVSMIPLYNSSSTDVPTWETAIDNSDYYLYAANNSKFSDGYISFSGNFTSTYSLWSKKITVMGLVNGAAYNIASGQFPYYPIGADNDITHYIYNSGHSQVKYCRRYNEEVLADIYKQCAYFGVFFVGDGNFDPNYSHLLLTDNEVFLGTIVDGLTYGDYTRGEENAEQPQFTWDDTSDSEYDPSVPPKVDPNNYNVPMKNNYPWLSSPNRLYSINSTNVSTIIGLYNALWQCYYTNNVGTGENQKPPTEFNYDEFLTISPIDTIISLKLFPYDTAEGTTPVGVRLGRYLAGINAYPAKKFDILDFGTVNIFAYFGAAIEGDWRDRETKYTLYAPFCGTLELDPAFYMGKTVGLQYWIDQITGACTAALYMNDDRGVQIFPDTISGVCAVDVPITGLDQATIQSQIFNANQQLKIANVNAASGILNSVLSVGAAAAKGDALSGATSFLGGIGNFIKSNAGVESAQYNLTHNKTAPRQIGSASPLSAMLGDWTPRIIISKPVDPLSKTSFKTFSETKGVACIIPGKIGSRKGFIQMQNVKLQAPEAATAAMTQTEAEMIKSLLSSGIFIK